MRTFRVTYSGDVLNERGEFANGYLGTELFSGTDHIIYDFARDLAPTPGDSTYWDRLYSLEIGPHHVARSNAIVVIRPYIRASAFTKGANDLVVIGRAGVGCDKTDLAACTANNVAVFNAPSTLIHSTASATMLLIMALARKLPAQERLARSGDWQDQPKVIGDDLCGQTLGIVGLGRIAEELVRLLKPFDMRVLAFSPSRKQEDVDKIGVTLVPDLDTVLCKSDYICLLGALNDRTRGMIGEHELRLMKPTAYFVNTGRGELVQQHVLVRALEERRIAGAGLDVYETEPLPAEDPLTKLDNVILTPHWLPTTHQVIRNVSDTISRGILRAAQGQVPDNIVNKDVLDRPGFQAKLAIFAENRTD